MGWYRNLKIRTKILVSSLMFVILLAVLAGQSYLTLQSANQTFQDFFTNRFVPVRTLNIMFKNILQMRINMLQEMVAIRDNDFEEAIRRIEYSKKLYTENDKIWDDFMKLDLTEKEKAMASTYFKHQNENTEVRSKFEEAIRDRNYDLAKKYEIEWLNGYDALKNSMDTIMQHQQDVAKELQAQQIRDGIRSGILILVLLVASIILSVVITFTLNSSVAKPLVDAMTRIRDIAEGEGDLTKRLDVSSKDEVGQLADWLNRFIDRVHGIVKQISENTENVFESAGELSESSQSLSAGTEEMSTQSQSIATSATQMNQNFQVISSSVEEMSISIQEVAKKSADASSVAGQADRTATTANEMISRLGVDAQDIGKVIESIVGIANQTNLLALNASIEAAGAGDAGKGFAVVAAEVKELARQAGESSEDIKGKIGAIQGSTEKAVASIGEINEVIKQVNDISSAIASAVEEQSITAKEVASNVQQATNAANDVAKNIEGISQASQEGARNAARSNELASNLNKYAGKLREIVNQFRI